MSPVAAQDIDAEIRAEQAEELVKARSAARIESVRPEMSFEFRQFNAPIGGTIEASGIITERSHAALAALIARLDDEGNYATYISFNSEGGNLGAAMKLGELLRQKRIGTVVDRANRCLSACAIAFLGGVFRSVDNGSMYEPVPWDDQGQLGYHSFGFAQDVGTILEPKEATEFAREVSTNTQITLGDLARYVAAMGADPIIIQLSAPYGPKDFLFLPVSRLDQLRILSREEEPGEFRLIPDGDAVIAVSIGGDRQMILGCESIRGGRPVPVIVFGILARETRQDPVGEWKDAVTLSAILAAGGLPWSAEDRAHKHFHAEKWLPAADFSATFGILDIGREDAAGNPAPILLTEQNSRFIVRDGALYVVIAPGAEVVAEIAASDDLYLVMAPDSGIPMSFVQRFKPGQQDRGNIDFALRACVK
ncbi:MAG: hypothetical protein Q7T68_05350 [Sphingopyxis sp.]|nr:hypothetical protein [Sphingopyxis sp.]